MIKRRSFLKTAGRALPALPLLASSLGRAEEAAAKPKRLVCIGLDLSLRPEAFSPAKPGADYELSPLLKPMARWKDQLTVFSKLDHPGVSGGHSAVHTFLTGVRREQREGFEDGCLSLDQRVAGELGHLTRFPFMCFGVGGGDSISWTRSGVNLAKIEDPTRAYDMLFAPQDPAARATARKLSAEDTSVAALLQQEAKKLKPSLDQWDREKLDEFAESVHEFETKTKALEKWIDAPVPEAKGSPPRWSSDGCLDKVRATFDVMSLALQSDSTRIMTMNIGISLPVADRIPGVSRSYHDLSHSGKDPDKLAQLHRVESSLVSELDHFLDTLAKAKDVDGSSMLDNTLVVFGSGMGNASSHSNRSLPVIVAGGGIRHGRHLHFEKEGREETPLSNLYVTLMNEMGMEADRFATSDGDLNELLA